MGSFLEFDTDRDETRMSCLQNRRLLPTVSNYFLGFSHLKVAACVSIINRTLNKLSVGERIFTKLWSIGDFNSWYLLALKANT